MKKKTISLIIIVITLGSCSEPVTDFTCVNDSPRYDDSFDLTYKPSKEFYAIGKPWIIIETTDHHYTAVASLDFNPLVFMTRYDTLNFSRIGEDHTVTLTTSELGRKILQRSDITQPTLGVYTCKETTRF